MQEGLGVSLAFVINCKFVTLLSSTVFSLKGGDVGDAFFGGRIFGCLEGVRVTKKKRASWDLGDDPSLPIMGALEQT